ncbi:hypothetical protein ACQZ5G_06010 [Agrobacterium sp. 22-214-1]
MAKRNWIYVGLLAFISLGLLIDAAVWPAGPPASFTANDLVQMIGIITLFAWWQIEDAEKRTSGAAPPPKSPPFCSHPSGLRFTSIKPAGGPAPRSASSPLSAASSSSPSSRFCSATGSFNRVCSRRLSCVIPEQREYVGFYDTTPTDTAIAAACQAILHDGLMQLSAPTRLFPVSKQAYQSRQ